MLHEKGRNFWSDRQIRLKFWQKLHSPKSIPKHWFVSPIFWAQIRDPSLPSWTFGPFFIIFRVFKVFYVSFMYFLFLEFVFKYMLCLLAVVIFMYQFYQKIENLYDLRTKSIFSFFFSISWCITYTEHLSPI
jgi:hypothetical protein